MLQKCGKWKTVTSFCAHYCIQCFLCQKGHTTWILTGPASNFLRFLLLAQVLGPQKLLQKSLQLLWMLFSVNQTTTWGLLLWFLVKDYFRDEKCLENETMLCSCTSTGRSKATVTNDFSLTNPKNKKSGQTQSFLESLYAAVLVFWCFTIVRWKKSCSF